jgi:hypothetical protein
MTDTGRTGRGRAGDDRATARIKCPPGAPLVLQSLAVRLPRGGVTRVPVGGVALYDQLRTVHGNCRPDRQAPAGAGGTGRGSADQLIHGPAGRVGEDRTDRRRLSQGATGRAARPGARGGTGSGARGTGTATAAGYDQCTPREHRRTDTKPSYVHASRLIVVNQRFPASGLTQANVRRRPNLPQNRAVSTAPCSRRPGEQARADRSGDRLPDR